MEMQDTQNIEGGCCYILAIAEHHPKELDIGPELEHQVGSRWVEAEQNDQLVGNWEQRCHQHFGHQQALQQLEHAPRLACVDSLPPSCGPSTPFGSP